jgi:hypothetical protein
VVFSVALELISYAIEGHKAPLFLGKYIDYPHQESN